MTSLLWQTVKQHCAAVLAILVSVPHSPLVHFVIKQMLEADLYDEQFQSNSCITLMNTLRCNTFFSLGKWELWIGGIQSSNTKEPYMITNTMNVQGKVTVNFPTDYFFLFNTTR